MSLVPSQSRSKSAARASLQRIAAVLLATSLASCPAIEVRGQDPSEPLQQPLVLNLQGDLIHEGSGFVFADAYGEFQRVRVTQYDAKGFDLSIGYNAGTGFNERIATVYVYPAPKMTYVGSPDEVVEGYERQTLGRHFASLVESMRARYPRAEFAEPSVFQVDLADGRHEGKSFRFDDGLMRSIGSLFMTGDGWLVKVRYSFPRASAAEAEAALDELLGAMPWQEQDAPRHKLP